MTHADTATGVHNLCVTSSLSVHNPHTMLFLRIFPAVKIPLQQTFSVHRNCGQEVSGCLFRCPPKSTKEPVPYKRKGFRYTNPFPTSHPVSSYHPTDRDPPPFAPPTLCFVLFESGFLEDPPGTPPPQRPSIVTPAPRAQSVPPPSLPTTRPRPRDLEADVGVLRPRPDPLRPPGGRPRRHGLVPRAGAARGGGEDTVAGMGWEGCCLGVSKE